MASGVSRCVRTACRVVGVALIAVLPGACTGGSDADSAARATSTNPTHVVPLGHRVLLDDGSTVQVFSYEPSATPSNEFSRPQPGKTFSAIDVEGCAGGQGSSNGVVNPFFFTLLMADNARIQTSIPVKEPGLGVGPTQAGECLRGFVTYEVPASSAAVAVVFEANGVNVRWTIS